MGNLSRKINYFQKIMHVQKIKSIFFDGDTVAIINQMMVSYLRANSTGNSRCLNTYNR